MSGPVPCEPPRFVFIGRGHSPTFYPGFLRRYRCLVISRACPASRLPGYAALRVRHLRRMHRVESLADIILLLGMTGIGAACVLFAWTVLVDTWATLDFVVLLPPTMPLSWRHLRTLHTCSFVVGTAEGLALPHALKRRESVRNQHAEAGALASARFRHECRRSTANRAAATRPVTSAAPFSVPGQHLADYDDSSKEGSDRAKIGKS